MPATPAARLARAIVGYLVLMVAIITLAPFRFASAPVHALSLEWNVRDVVLNIVLFMPIGFSYRLGRARGPAAAWLPALLLGATISTGIECAQLFVPERYPAVSDILSNALGAALGALVAANATRTLEGARTVRAFALDLPLVGLTYLTVPILWLTGLSLRPGEAPLLLLPSISAAWIIASVHASYSSGAAPGLRPLLQPAMGGALFVAIAFLPAMPFAPGAVVLAAITFTVVAWARLRAPRSVTHERLPNGPPSRRFEGPTLRVAMVPLVLFVVFLALLPLDAPVVAWRGTLALLPLGADVSARALFRIMAQASAFAALGYAVAELGARAVDSVRGLAPRVLVWALLLAASLELLRGWRAGSVASALVLAISAGAALFGAWIFVLQLRNVRALFQRDDASQSDGATVPSAREGASRSTGA